MPWLDLRRGILEDFAQHGAVARRERTWRWVAWVEAMLAYCPSARRQKYLRNLAHERARNRAYMARRYHEVLKHDPIFIAANRAKARASYWRRRKAA